MANDVSIGRYIPTAISIGLRTCIRMKASPMNIPAMIRIHSVFRSKMPLATTAIRLAWGAAIFSPPKPPLAFRISFCFSGIMALMSARLYVPAGMAAWRPS